jgi:hypothetical protein
MKTGIPMVERCCMCKSSGESVDHLLLHCDTTYELWSYIFSMFGFHWIIPKSMVELLSG